MVHLCCVQRNIVVTKEFRQFFVEEFRTLVGLHVAWCGDLRLKNVKRIIFAHININSIRNKFHLLTSEINDKIDILMISETKLDSSFPKSEFIIPGYTEPYRFDRNRHGGGILLYIRSDIPSKEIPSEVIHNKFNCNVIDICIFPDHLKTANVTPILKQTLELIKKIIGQSVFYLICPKYMND